MPAVPKHPARNERLQTRTDPFLRPAALIGFLLLIVASLLLANQVIRHARGAEPDKPPAANDDTAKAKKDPFAWRSLFDGKTLKGWKVPVFGGDGKVEVKDGAIILGAGETMTGIKYTGKVPRTNYELEWEGKRLDGVDFFATATFPVGENCVSFVTGGWGGTVVGISCVDFYDASDNATSNFMQFKDKQWYKFRVRVSDAKIECWVDKEQVVDLPRKGHKFDIRAEVDLCQPLGISSWCTTGAVRNIRIRDLKPTEIKAAAESAEEF